MRRQSREDRRIINKMKSAIVFRREAVYSTAVAVNLPEKVSPVDMLDKIYQKMVLKRSRLRGSIAVFV